MSPASPDRLSSSGSGMREGKSHVPVGRREGDLPKYGSCRPPGADPGRGSPPTATRRHQGRDRARSTAPVSLSRDRGSEPTQSGGTGSAGPIPARREDAHRRRRVCPGPQVRGGPSSGSGRGSPCPAER